MFSFEYFSASEDAAARSLDKVKNQVELPGGLHHEGEAVKRFCKVHAAVVEDSVNLLNTADALMREVVAPKTYDVHAREADGLARREDERRYVLVNQSSALNHYVRAEMAELMDKSTSADYGAVVDNHFAGELGGVAHYYVVAERAVMGHVAVCHEQTVVADDGPSLGCGASVDGHALAECGAVAYYGKGLLATELEVLRLGAHDRSGKERAVTADAGTVHDSYVADKAGAVADFDISLHIAEGADLDIRANLCRGIDTCH